MKLNIAYPTNGTQHCKEIKTKDEQKLYGLKVNEQFNGSIINEEFADSIFQIQGGNDYQGVCMVPKQDTPKKIRLLLSKGSVGYRCRQKGVRRRKTVRGSVVSNEIQVLNLILVKTDKEFPGLTDVVRDKSRLPKKIHKLRNSLGMPEDEVDVESFLKKLFIENGRPESEIPKIKVKGLDQEIKRKEYEEYQKLKEERKMKFMKEKALYESKYLNKLDI